MKITIVGASGYTGRELLKILAKHPESGEISVTSTRFSGKTVSDVHPSLDMDLKFEELDFGKAKRSDVVFCCVPHTKAMAIVPKLKTRVIDLSADFRLKDARSYEEYYGVEHTAPKLLKKAVYGLPELYREEIKRASLVANPGCFPTAIILGLKPLLRFKPERIIADAKTGFSGAGRESEEPDFISNLKGNIVPYKVVGHQHTPEIEQELGVAVGFTPHLVPLDRGILSTFHVYMEEDVDAIVGEYKKFYDKEPFVKLVDEVPTLHRVQDTNYCHIGGFAKDNRGRLVFFSAIDNLIKGASGQAVQNMNIMFGFKETCGL